MTHHVDSVCLHTLTEEALASRCPGLHSKEHQSFLYPLNTVHFEKSLYVPLTRTFPETQSCTPLYYEKPMKMNTLWINIVYSSKSVSISALNLRKEETEREESCICDRTFSTFPGSFLKFDLCGHVWILIFGSLKMECIILYFSHCVCMCVNAPCSQTRFWSIKSMMQ